MKLYPTLLNTFFCLTLFSFVRQKAICQEPLYNIKFIKAAHITLQSQDKIVVICVITPKELKDFPPVVSTKIIYSFDGGSENKLDIMHPDGKINLSAYDRGIQEKNPQVYNLIKDRVDLSGNSPIGIFVFTFINLPTEHVKKMSITYGFWEKLNQNRRVERKYDLNVD